MKKHAKSYGGHRARAMGFDSASIFDADEKTQPASQVSLSNQLKPPLGRKLQYTETSALNELLFNEIGVGDSYQCIYPSLLKVLEIFSKNDYNYQHYEISSAQ